MEKIENKNDIKPYQKQVLLSNAYIKANQKLTLMEKQLIGYCISSVSKAERDKATSMTYLEDYANNRSFTIRVKEFAEYFNYKHLENVYRDVKRSAKSLFDRSEQIVIKNEKNEIVEFYRWVDHIKYNIGEGTITLSFTYDIYRNLFCHFNGNYTNYNLKVGLSFKTFYAHRIFELLQTRKDTNKLILRWNDFFFFLNLPDSYRVPSQLKRRVLDPVIKEFKEKYNINLVIDLDYRKNDPTSGRVIISADKNNDDIVYEIYGITKKELDIDDKIIDIEIQEESNDINKDENETKVSTAFNNIKF